MKLWLVAAKSDWDPWYDKANAFVVRAPSAYQARRLASQQHGDEGEAVWLDSSVTTCFELKPEGEAGVILRDYSAG